MMRVCQNCGQAPDPHVPRHQAQGRITKGRCFRCYQHLLRYGKERIIGPCPTCGHGRKRQGAA